MSSSNLDDETVTTESEREGPSNEYVLNVAFLSFLGFTTLQLVFALMARSQAMMEDCSAMYVDVVTYLFNFLAERFKHSVHNSGMKPKTIRLYRLYLELVPPLISVATLVVVTVVALRYAIVTIMAPPDLDEQNAPDLQIMLIFSFLNLLLDFVNVSCFARVNQAVGLADGSKLMLSASSGANVGQHCHTCPTETTALVSSKPDWDKAAAAAGSGDMNDTKDDDDDDDTASKDTEIVPGINLNMCSAWTHVCADTLRSIAVLLAAGFAYLFPSLLTAADADSWGVIVVSFIILVSLAPLLQGLYLTVCEIYHTYKYLDDQLHHFHFKSGTVVLIV